jgi:hypothetical protein
MTATLMLVFASAPRSVAQTSTTPTPVPAAQPTVAGPSSTVDGLLTVCADGAVVNFSGTLISGWDIFFQLFAGTAGSGTALSSLRQVQVDGAFSFNERVAFSGGTTIAAGQSASAMVLVARENDSSVVDFDFVLTDVQDGCGAETAGSTATTSVEVSGSATTATTGTTPVAQHILAPNGGTLNPNLQPEPPVVIGDRLSDYFRSDTPGLIFAECNAFPMALPGIIYDTDTVTVFWSWFTRTDEQMEQHLANANYSVKLNQAPFPNVVQSLERRGNNSWVFFSAEIGNLAPGHYEVEYRLTWDQPVNDGFDDFGPGTDNPIQANNCKFQVARNPNNVDVAHSGMYLPMAIPAHYVEPDY